MDILLVKPYSDLSNALPPIGLGYLSSSLKSAGFESKIIHCFKDKIDIPGIINLANKKNVKNIGVTCCSNDHFWLQRLADSLDTFSDINLIVGGPHPTGLSVRLMELIPRINFLVRAEGEYTIVELLKCHKNNSMEDNFLDKIPNLVWKNSKNILVENEVRLPEILDSLPLPDWDQLNPTSYVKFSPHGGFAKTPPVAQLITTRGCPFTCRYCASYIMNGHIIRKRSPESIIEEIDFLRKKHKIREIHIEDDNFTFYKDHVINVCTAIRRKGIKLNFGLPNGVRLDKLDEEILSELKNTGFYFLSVGIESGSSATLKKMNKRLNFDLIRERISLVKKYEFRLKGFFILGYPGETEGDIYKTIKFAKSLDLDQAYFSIYIPIPGTDEFNRLVMEGKLDISNTNWKNYYTGNFSIPPYIPENMSAAQLKKIVSLAYRSFYFRPKILYKMAKEISSLSQIKHLVKRSLSLIHIQGN